MLKLKPLSIDKGDSPIPKDFFKNTDGDYYSKETDDF